MDFRLFLFSLECYIHCKILFQEKFLEILWIGAKMIIMGDFTHSFRLDRSPSIKWALEPMSTGCVSTTGFNVDVTWARLTVKRKDTPVGPIQTSIKGKTPQAPKYNALTEEHYFLLSLLWSIWKAVHAHSALCWTASEQAECQGICAGSPRVSWQGKEIRKSGMKDRRTLGPCPGGSISATWRIWSLRVV